MKKTAFIVIGLLVAFLVLQSCSSSPEKGLLSRYFNAVTLNDNDTMSAMALEPVQVDLASWSLDAVSPERIEPASLPGLNKAELEYKKLMEQHVGPTMDAKDFLDAAKEELDLARTAGAKAAAKKKVDEFQLKFDEEYNKQKDLQKGYNDAKAAAASEEQITLFSLGQRELPMVRDLTGNVHSKEVDVTVKTKTGQAMKYKLIMRMYQLKDEATGLRHNGRWIITKFESGA